MWNNKLSVLTAVCGMTLFMAGSEARAEKIGVLALYDVDKRATVSVDRQKIGDLGCRLRREGIIVDEQSDLDLAEPNRFVLLACDGSLLGDPGERSLLETLILKGKAVAILEGALFDMPDARRASAVSDRQYILKVGYYNNRDVTGRERDLDRLSQTASARPDTYVTESFIGVTRALGMPTPDEVVVLFYDSPAQGERFREGNADVLSMIGAFNDKHLDSYIYFVGKATQ